MAHIAARKQRVLHLYRHALKTCLSWKANREVWYGEARKIRDEFEANKDEGNELKIERLIARGEAELWEFAHPDPYTAPYYKGGSLYHRNPPIPPEMKMHFDYAREPEYEN